MSERAKASDESGLQDRLRKEDDSFTYEKPLLRKHGKISDVTNLNPTPITTLDAFFGIGSS